MVKIYQITDKGAMFLADFTGGINIISPVLAGVANTVINIG
jgi:hypothetical protein